jgi:phosphate transport system permease protein
VSYNPTSFSSDFTVLPLLIFKWSTEVQEEFRGLAAAAIIVLLLLLFTLNFIAIVIRDRSRIDW